MSSNNKRRLLSLLLVILSLAPYLSRTWCGLAETQSYLDTFGVTVECVNPQSPFTDACDCCHSALIDGAFYKSRLFMRARAPFGESVYFRIDLTERRLIKTVWLNLYEHDQNRKKDFANGQIFVGDGTEPISGTLCNTFTASGSIECSYPLEGRYVFIYMTSAIIDYVIYPEISEVRVFGLENLTKDATISAESTHQINIDRLLQNVSVRDFHLYKKPSLGANASNSQMLTANFYSCTTTYRNYFVYNIFELTQVLKAPAQVGAVILMQSLVENNEDYELHNFNVYVGNNANYKENTLCANGPYSPNQNGIEVWCDLHGQYVSVVRDYENENKPSYLDICDMAVFGEYSDAAVENDAIVTVLGREPHTLSSSYTFELGQFYEFEVSHITTSTNAKVGLRIKDGYSQDWLTITNYDESAFITFAAMNYQLAGQTIEIELESYDLGSSEVYQTDVIELQFRQRTTYERSEALEETIEIPKLLNSTLVVKQIYPSQTLPMFEPLVRQKEGEELQFVTILTQNSTEAEIFIDAAKLNAGEYSLVLEAYNSASSDQIALKTNLITILVRDFCVVTQEEIDQYSSLIKKQPIRLEQFYGSAELITASYSTKYELAYQAYKLDQEDHAHCPPMEVEFKNSNPVLSYNDDGKSITLDPKEQGEFEAEIEFNYDGLTLTAPIEATVTQCVIGNLAFQATSQTISYEIGSGIKIENIPQLNQNPDCGVELSVQYIVTGIESTLTDEQVNQIVTIGFDEQDIPSFIIQTDEQAFSGLDLAMNIGAVSLDFDLPVKELNFKVKFEEKVDDEDAGQGEEDGEEALRLEFDMTKFSVEPLQCSIEDESWSMKLPPVIDQDSQEVSVKWDPTNSALFSLDKDSQTVFIHPDKKQSVINGKLCPTRNVVVLKFQLESDILGQATESLQVPVFLFKNFETAETSNENLDSYVEPEKLKVDTGNIDISSVGKLSMRFNKPIKIAGFLQNSTDPDSLRNLKEEQIKTIEASELFQIKVQGAEDEEYLDKGISSIRIDEVNENSIEISLNFNQPSMISNELTSPDMLEVKLIKPDAIIDVETNEPIEIEDSDLTFMVQLGLQYTQGELEELLDLQAQAETMGTILVILQIALLFAVNKTLTSMWVLINNLQFFIFIGMWKISYPKYSRTIFTQLERITQGQYIDDLELGSKVASFFGITQSERGPEVKEGSDRLGTDSFFGNLGITILLVSIGLLLLVIVTVMLVKYSQSCRLSKKAKERVKWLQQKVFYNPLIRFSMLNTLKWNLLTLTAFTALKGSTTEIVFGVLLYIVLNLLPFFYLWLLYKQQAKLSEEKTIKTIGTLYDGLQIKRLPFAGHEGMINDVWFYPAVFMIRRSLFILITVVLFDYPFLQMPINQALSLAYIRYLCKWNLFESRSRFYVEVASEFIGILACVCLQQFLLPLDPQEQDFMENTFITLIVVMILVNGAYLIWNIIRKRRIKKHEKGLAKLKKFKKKQRKLNEKKSSQIKPEPNSVVQKKENATADQDQKLSDRQRTNQKKKLLVTMGDISEAPENDLIDLSEEELEQKEMDKIVEQSNQAIENMQDIDSEEADQMYELQ